MQMWSTMKEATGMARSHFRPSLVPSAKLIDVPTSISSTVLSGHTELGPHPCPALAPGRCPGQRLLQLLLACPAAWLVPGKRLGQASWVLWDSGLESDSKWRVGGCWRRGGPRIKRVLWDFHFCLGWMLPGTKAGTLQPFTGLLWNLFFLLLHSSLLSFIQFGNLQAAFCQHWSHWHKAQRCLKISRVGSKQYILIQECPAQKVWAEKKELFLKTYKYVTLISCNLVIIPTSVCFTADLAKSFRR